MLKVLPCGWQVATTVSLGPQSKPISKSSPATLSCPNMATSGSIKPRWIMPSSWLLTGNPFDDIMFVLLWFPLVFLQDLLFSASDLLSCIVFIWQKPCELYVPGALHWIHLLSFAMGENEKHCVVPSSLEGKGDRCGLCPQPSACLQLASHFHAPLGAPHSPLYNQREEICGGSGPQWIYCLMYYFQTLCSVVV